ncbi:MAG: IS3 family transposase, partial [Clostridia bacterium]|nr:IS3 family transposase [Clostridia bacterium]
VECVDRAHFRTREEAKDEIAAYLLFYNRHRIHQSLGYLTPVDFEQLCAA